MFQQPFVAWTVARMEFVKQENVAVIRAMSETYAINCLVMYAALNMDNAKMVLVYAHKVGMDDTALCVCIFFFFCFLLLKFKYIMIKFILTRDKMNFDYSVRTNKNTTLSRLDIACKGFGSWNLFFCQIYIFPIFLCLIDGKKCRETYLNSFSSENDYDK